MSATQEKRRYIPCPYCKGSGGVVEAVLDYGEGPFYDCGACGGSGKMGDYQRRRDSGMIHVCIDENCEPGPAGSTAVADAILSHL
jgi:uncharacterized Zn finger protein